MCRRGSAWPGSLGRGRGRRCGQRHVQPLGEKRPLIGDLIDLQSLVVSVQDSTLNVTVKYVVRQTQEAQTQTFQRSGVQ